MRDNNIQQSCDTTIHVATAEQMGVLGICLGRLLQAGDCLALNGPLGAGKTCLVTGIGEGMGVEGRVASPSFIVMRAHPGKIHLYHADAYRLSGPEELEEAGLYEWLEHGVVAIEWAEIVEDALPEDVLRIDLDYDGEGRVLTLHAKTPRHKGLTKALKECVTWE